LLHKIKRPDGELEIDLDEKHRYWLNGKQLSGGTKVAQRFASPSFSIAANWAGRCAGKKAEEILSKVMTKEASLDELTIEKMVKSITNAHWGISSEAKETGTLVHEALEKLINARMDGSETPPAPIHTGARTAFNAFLTWEEENQPEYLGSEEVIYYCDPSSGFDYTGTLDLVFRLQGNLCLGDFKTSKVFTEEMIAQVALYATAYEQCHQEKVKKLFIFRLPKTDDGELEIIDFDFNPKWRKFCRQMNDLDHFQREVAKELRTKIKELRNAKN